MRKKYNIKDNFEDVYLRSNQIKTYVNNADPALLKEKDFKRVTTYITNRFYQKYRTVYEIGGFEFEDLLSVSTIFGLMFSGYNGEYKSSNDFYTIMMRFIGQRLSRMVQWIAKKFQLNDLTPNSHCSSELLQNLQHKQLGVCVVIDGEVMNSQILPPLTFQYRLLEQEICVLEGQYERMGVDVKKEADRDCRASLRGRRARLGTQIGKSTFKLREYRARQTKLRKKDKERSAVLKEKLQSTWDQHTDKLAYYSVSKFVAFDVRKSAREHCRRYGINYSEWASQQIQDQKLSESDITTN